MLSANLVWGLLIFLPGLAFHLSLFSQNDHSVEVNHNTNPATYFGSISIGTVIAHFILSALLFVNEFVVKQLSEPLFNIDFNIYAFSTKNLSNINVAVLCGSLIFLCITMYVFAKSILRFQKISSFIIDLKYGPFSEFYKKTSDKNTLWLAHILTKTERQTTRYKQHLAYIGRVEKLVTSSGAISEIHLGDANPFFIKMTDNDFSTVDFYSGKGKKIGAPLDYICISHPEILNIVFISHTPEDQTIEKFDQIES